MGLVLAHTVLALPFVVVNVTATLQGFDVTLERAALSLGANRLVAFMKVTLPIIWPGIMSGALFAFITSFDEVVIAIFLCGSKPTLPKQMWDGIRIAINPTISAVSSLLIVLSIVLLLVLQLVRSRTK
jgi:putative spermidine/putrescine transport system permease protein